MLTVLLLNKSLTTMVPLRREKLKQSIEVKKTSLRNFGQNQIYKKCSCFAQPFFFKDSTVEGLAYCFDSSVNIAIIVEILET